jgi:hypothetical protein
MIDKINNDKITEFAEKLANTQPDRPKSPQDSPKSDSIQVSFADLVDQAVKASDANPDIVQKAKQLLNSGQLDTPENIRSAAENILKSGI